MPTIPIAVNFHVTRVCNSRCRFCFATFHDLEGQLSLDEALRLIERLRAAGTEKLNFAGGEPTLHPHIGELVEHAKSLGLVTSVVTNGFRLERLLDGHADSLDWVGLSIDSASERTQVELGRGRGDHVASSIRLAARCRAAEIRVKLNTVVTARTWREDMTALVRAIRPERWKVFQVLPIGGQNDGMVEELLITSSQFQAFVHRHDHLKTEDLAPIVEDNEAMRGSYVMVDPLGRFFGNSTGFHVYSAPILEVDVERALAMVSFDEAKFTARGGRYAW